MRGDERNVGGRAAASTSRVDERSLEERAVFAVESASSGLEVCDGGGEGTVAGVGSTSREDTTTLDQSGSTVAATVVKDDSVGLGLDTQGSDERESDSRNNRLGREHD